MRMIYKHQRKVHELINTLASTLKITAERLYHSGGIEPDDYDPDHYVLAKILVTAAIHQHQDDFAPPFKGEYREVVENLQHF